MRIALTLALLLLTACGSTIVCVHVRMPACPTGRGERCTGTGAWAAKGEDFRDWTQCEAVFYIDRGRR